MWCNQVHVLVSSEPRVRIRVLVHECVCVCVSVSSGMRFLSHRRRRRFGRTIAVPPPLSYPPLLFVS